MKLTPAQVKALTTLANGPAKVNGKVSPVLIKSGFILNTGSYVGEAPLYKVTVEGLQALSGVNAVIEAGLTAKAVANSTSKATDHTAPITLPAKLKKVKKMVAEPALTKPLTAMQLIVLKALFDSSSNNGHDFGLIEDAKAILARASTLTVYQVGGVISTMVERGDIFTYKPEKVTVVSDRARKYLQYVLSPAALKEGK